MLGLFFFGQTRPPKEGAHQQLDRMSIALSIAWLAPRLALPVPSSFLFSLRHSRQSLNNNTTRSSIPAPVPPSKGVLPSRFGGGGRIKVRPARILLTARERVRTLLIRLQAFLLFPVPNCPSASQLASIPNSYSTKRFPYVCLIISLYAKDASKASTLAAQVAYICCPLASSGKLLVNCLFYNTRNRLSKRSQREDELLVCWQIFYEPEGNKFSK